MTWRLKPIFDSYLTVALIVAGLAAVLMAPPLFDQLTRQRRRLLWALRGGVIALLALTMLRPTCVTTTRRPRSRTVLLLLDRSRSMQLPHAATGGGESRWTRQSRLMDEARGALERLAKSSDIRLYAFDRELTPLESGAWQTLRPEGAQTDIGASAEQAVRQALGRRLAAVFLLSDGVQTATSASVDIHQPARELARLGVPLYTLPLGPAGDFSQARDVALENLPEHYSGFVGNQLLIRGEVRVRGYVNQPIVLELSAVDPQDGAATAGRTEVVARQDGQVVPVEMLFTPEQEGDYKLTLQAAEQEGEMVTANNALTAYLHVQSGLRIAYLYGTLIGEQQALRRSLGTLRGMQLDDRYVDIRSRNSWPQDHSDMIASPKYDAFLLESVPATAFRPQDLESLAELVDSGKGLMMIGGPFSFGPGGYQESPLQPVLPVTMGRLERQSMAPQAPLAPGLHWVVADGQSGLAMLPARDHAIVRLAAPSQNRQAWSELPPLSGANRLQSAPETQVLAVGPNREPLLIAGQFGSGRVLAFAGDSTSRWWRHGFREQHQRFWRQATMWLVKREQDDRQEIWLDLGRRRRFDPGARIMVRGGVRSSTPQTQGASFQLQLIPPDGPPQALPFSQEGEEIRSRTEELDAPGEYRLRIVARRNGEEIGAREAAFEILDRDLEFSVASSDHDQLARLAQLTQQAGGKLLAAEELAPLLDTLASQPPVDEIDQQTSWELASEWWDASLLFLALLTLLSCEWYLRKRWRMV